MGILLFPACLTIAVMSAQMPAQHRIGMVAFGLGFALLLPVIYAVMGFVQGALGGLIYNLVAKWIGGIEVEVE
ncbi:MAG: DUF3566 domain-containing protein [Opitutaceae bacterium]|nr:DUF3566 domain-containing protein [Opitutaceae bacterium]